MWVAAKLQISIRRTIEVLLTLAHIRRGVFWSNLRVT